MEKGVSKAGSSWARYPTQADGHARPTMPRYCS
jgi:hypothetical protein